MRNQIVSQRVDRLTTAIGVLAVAQAITFLVGALLHLGVSVPLGFTVLDEPRIIPATIVEGLCGLALLGGVYAALGRRYTWGRQALIGAHIVSIGGVILGMGALAVGAGPRTELNDIYHLVILTTLVVGLALLLLAPRVNRELMR